MLTNGGEAVRRATAVDVEDVVLDETLEIGNATAGTVGEQEVVGVRKGEVIVRGIIADGIDWQLYETCWL